MTKLGSFLFCLFVAVCSASSTKSPANRNLKASGGDDASKFKFSLGQFAFSLLPLSPEAIGRRKTILTEVVKGKVWTFDQLQGIINVNVPVRATLIRLKDGLFVHNPVAPTAECIEFVKQIEASTGLPVKYITLSTLGVEHKGTTGAFARLFPKATVFIQPGQYSFPINLPSAFFFAPGTVIKEIPRAAAEAPWNDEIDHIVLEPLKPKGVGGFSETAFFHRETETVLVTDLVVRVPTEPPAIIQDDPRALLYHARDTMLETVTDTPENRRKGWRRMVLFGLTFQPSGIKVKDTFEAIKMLKDVPAEMKKLGEGAIPYDGGLYPWDWVESEVPNFRLLQGDITSGKPAGLLVAPILQILILNRDPERVLQFVERICEWKFKRIIPCHLENNLKVGPKELRAAFSFLEEDPSAVIKSDGESNPFFSFIRKLTSPVTASSIRSGLPRADPRDCQLLQDASNSLTEQGVLYEVAPLVKPFRTKPIVSSIRPKL